jgi:predicted nicotinamide N-methyase
VTDAADFVAAHTRRRPVPLVPEIALHLADNLDALWARTGGEPPFWAFAWAGGQALARHVLDHPGLVAGRRVVDLAAGSGLVAIAAARAGAAHVRATDVDPYAVAATALNACANGVRVEADRSDLAEAATDPSTGAEVVLAGDVFYDRTLAERVLPVLARARDRGATVLVGDPHRRAAYLPGRGFTPVARYRVPVTAGLEDGPVKDVTIWRPAGA